MTGRRLDLENHCRAADEVVLGCRPPSDLRSADDPCVVRSSDGAVFEAMSGTGFHQDGWSYCSAEQIDQIGFRPCP